MIDYKSSVSYIDYQIRGTKMATFEIHCELCEKELGEAFPEVHLWLDAFFGQEPYGTRHRYLRHHRQGIEEVRKMWGDQAAKAAEIHIRQDLELEGWPPDKPIPEDGQSYRKAGLWLSAYSGFLICCELKVPPPPDVTASAKKPVLSIFFAFLMQSGPNATAWKNRHLRIL
jgi:hypothetical protein